MCTLLYTPIPEEPGLDGRTFIHPVSCTVSLRHSSECNNFRVNSLPSQGFPEGSLLVPEMLPLLCAVER